MTTINFNNTYSENTLDKVEGGFWYVVKHRSPKSSKILVYKSRYAGIYSVVEGLGTGEICRPNHRDYPACEYDVLQKVKVTLEVNNM